MIGYSQAPADIEAAAEKTAKANGSELSHVCGPDDVRELQAIHDSQARKADVLAAPFEGAQYSESESGEWKLDVPNTERNAAISRDLMQRQWSLETARGEKVSAHTPTIRVRTKTGEVVSLSASVERHLPHMGVEVHSVPSWRGCSVKRFSDGLLWRQVGPNWEPTGRCCLGTPLRPCGVSECEVCHGQG